MTSKPTEVIHEYKTRVGERVRFTTSMWKGKRLYSVRKYLKSNDFANGRVIWIPTKKGFTFGVEKFPEVMEGFKKLKKHVDSNRS